MTAPTIPLAILSCLLAAAPAGEAETAETPAAAVAAAALTPLAAYERLTAAGAPIAEEERTAIERVLADAASREPKDARWPLGLAVSRMQAGDFEHAKKHAKGAAKIDPNLAEAHYMHGVSIFATLANASLVGKMSGAGDGRDALLRAVKLDPNHVSARAALAQYYLQAPGIAGGSLKKAREQGEAMTRIAGGAVEGRLVLASAASKDKDWATMEREFGAALESAATDAQRFRVLAAHAGALLNDKEDPAAARPVIERLSPLAPPGDITAGYFAARERHLSGDHKAAAAAYEKVLEVRPEARNSRFYAAQCREAAGDTAQAVAHFEEFARRFPDDDRASDAKKAVRRLNKKK